MSISSVDSGPLHVKPQPDLNLATEANRIIYVLNKVIERAKLVGLLNEFVKDDAFLLKNVLDPSSHFFVLQTCESYLYSGLGRMSSSMDSSELSTSGSERSSRKSMRLDSKDDKENETLSTFSPSISYQSQKARSKQQDRNDSALSKVIFMLEENQKVQKLVNSMLKELSPQMKFFIKCLTEYKNLMEENLRENASQYKERQKYLRETYEKNEKAKKEIERLEEELVVTKTEANVCLIGRNILINRHQNKIEKIKKNSLEAIEKKVNESEKTMVNDWKNSVEQQKKLKQDYEQAAEKYANLLKEHLAIEKAMRAKRAKVENQVLGWIQKFDQDVGEKQAEEEEIQELLDKETDEVNSIQKQLDEQEEEYDELMQEKAEYEEEMLERRLYQFIVNRSARRIQITYRMYKARKLAKKLAKKGKKGKKK